MFKPAVFFFFFWACCAMAQEPDELMLMALTGPVLPEDARMLEYQSALAKIAQQKGLGEVLCLTGSKEETLAQMRDRLAKAAGCLCASSLTDKGAEARIKASKGEDSKVFRILNLRLMACQGLADAVIAFGPNERHAAEVRALLEEAHILWVCAFEGQDDLEALKNSANTAAYLVVRFARLQSLYRVKGERGK